MILEEKFVAIGNGYRSNSVRMSRAKWRNHWRFSTSGFQPFFSLWYRHAIMLFDKSLASGRTICFRYTCTVWPPTCKARDSSLRNEHRTTGAQRTHILTSFISHNRLNRSRRDKLARKWGARASKLRIEYLLCYLLFLNEILSWWKK